MAAVFTKLLNMSITAGWLILAVLLLRLLFRRAPKWTRCLLWAMVAVRLLFPFSLESVWSLLPSGETVVTHSPTPSAPSIQPGGAQIVIQSGIPLVDNTVNPIISERLPSSPTESIDLWQIAAEVAGYVWVVGAILLAVYALISYLRLRHRVRASICKEKNVYVCDDVRSPFILGIVRPKIYLPSGMDAQTASYVLAHEQAHVKRRDHWWKPFGYLLLTVYWFHPLVWVAYILLCRDIELACDEKVVRDLQRDERAAYSQALLDCSMPRRLIAACPLAFGEVSVKNRVKKVLHYKKPTVWIIVISLIVCAVVAVCFLTNPKQDAKEPLGSDEESTEETTGEESTEETTGEETTDSNENTLLTYEPLSDEMALKIKQSYLKNVSSDYTTNDLSIEYWGEYNGSYVLFMHGPWLYWQGLQFLVTGDYVFKISDSRKMIVYHEPSDSFLNLEEAYETGWLTQNNIALLHARYVKSIGGEKMYEAILKQYKEYLNNLEDAKETIEPIPE